MFSRVWQQYSLGEGITLLLNMVAMILQGQVAMFSGLGQGRAGQQWFSRVRQQSSLGQGRVGQGSNGSLGLGSNALYRRVAVFSRVVQQCLSGVGQHYCYLRQNSSYFQGCCSNDRVVLWSSKTDSLGYFRDDSPCQANSGCLRQGRNVLQCRIAMILQVEQQWLPRQDSNGSLCRIVIVLQVGQ